MEGINLLPEQEIKQSESLDKGMVIFGLIVFVLLIALFVFVFYSGIWFAQAHNL